MALPLHALAQVDALSGSYEQSYIASPLHTSAQSSSDIPLHIPLQSMLPDAQHKPSPVSIPAPPHALNQVAEFNSSYVQSNSLPLQSQNPLGNNPVLKILKLSPKTGREGRNNVYLLIIVVYSKQEKCFVAFKHDFKVDD